MEIIQLPPITGRGKEQTKHDVYRFIETAHRALGHHGQSYVALIERLDGVVTVAAAKDVETLKEYIATLDEEELREWEILALNTLH